MMAATATQERKQPAAAESSFWLWIFLGYVLFWYLQGGFRFPLLGAIRFEFIVGMLLSVVAVIRVVKRGPPRSAIVGWIGALIVVMLISVIFSVDSSLSWKVFVDRVVKFIMMGVFIVAFVDSVRALKLFIAAYLLAFLKMAQEGLVGLITGSLVWENQGTPRLHGSTPIYAHPNSFAGTQLGNIPFFYFLFPIVSFLARLLLAAMAISAVVIVIYSGSRTAYVALASTILCLIYFSRHRKRAFVGILLLSLVTAPLIPDAYWERFDTIITQEDKEGESIDTRRQIFEDAVQVWFEHPFGVGVGAFPVARQEAFGRAQDTHNLYLEVATNLGAHGLIIFFGLVFAIMRSLGRTRLRLEEGIRRLREDAVDDDDAGLKELQFLRAVTVSVLCFVLARLTLGLFGHDLYEIYWWFGAGLAIALERITQQKIDQTGGDEPARL